MVRAGEHMEFRRDTGIPKLSVQCESWRGATAIKGTGSDKGGRRTSCCLDRYAKRSRVDEDLKIRPSAYVIDGINWWWDGGGRIVRHQRHEFPAGRKAHDADPMRIYPIVSCMSANPADGPPRICRGVTFDRIGGAGLPGEPVFEDKARDAEAVQRSRRHHPLVLEDQHPVTTAGYDHDGNSVGALRISLGNGQRWPMDVMDVSAGLQPLRFCRMPLGSRGTSRPDRDRCFDHVWRRNRGRYRRD